jgi:hypothetical protein
MEEPGDPGAIVDPNIVDDAAVDQASTIEPVDDAASDQTTATVPVGDAVVDQVEDIIPAGGATGNGMVDEASDAAILEGLTDSGGEIKDLAEEGGNQEGNSIENELSSEKHEDVVNIETGQDVDSVDVRDIGPRKETTGASPAVLVVRASRAENETPTAPTVGKSVQVAICPSCRKRIQINKMEGHISYLCRACKKPLHFEITCASCSSHVEITQDELQNAPDNCLRCPVCLETVKM